MTATPWQFVLYAGGLLALFMTPGPVWLAIIARTTAGGFKAGWPIALGVAVGDALWPLLASLGMAWVVSEVEVAADILRWSACVVFLWMGVNTIRHARDRVEAKEGLGRGGVWSGFLAGVAVILSNPKAILFYMVILPGFFDMTAVGPVDITLIVILSMLIPMVGNIFFALMVDRLRVRFNTPERMRRMNLAAGSLLIVVGAILPFT
ncbi:LysE family translocator [Chachezhania sediminis]|uniref:LysE family translocator n=1 Tax=Chachezhania sediminis TaxID=2599291 RepID=UPI00131D938C|nr:LysE family transporter [Chachezhania sediminis]